MLSFGLEFYEYADKKLNEGGKKDGRLLANIRENKLHKLDAG